ncbi:MAG: protein-L-isoaspartate(D-aspartate) O-methyltransferase [gamma proteobacterium endosymbiont of Lamellibrachia anaximandri]|nr:protein-L-isoaspartate(D-aspartate) O-methyltransferase [gamma proteobacterium endosymbiont of Lamellibrachia anaximandri]MBL3619726.1 protein-L-isoaspartate(D-aspartate) O-methyltransferase [gamma proteobacterium endosymbiont of Lamellibrachia anaximandri]
MMSILLIVCTGVVDSRENDYPTLRQAMVEVIEASVLRTADYIDKEVLNPRVMEAMGTVPRHEFVPEAVKSSAYEDRPLPIGQGQTISQPYIVALMTDLMHPGPEQKVLEVGTGSGYQAAVLAELIDKVYTIEIIEELGEQAADRFHRLGYDNITPRVGDGYYGWEEHAPFDAILVTAASSHIPPPLIKQLKPGGRMVIPVGGHFMVQQLVLIEKTEQGKIITHQILPVRFVPLTGDH